MRKAPEPIAEETPMRRGPDPEPDAPNKGGGFGPPVATEDSPVPMGNDVKPKRRLRSRWAMTVKPKAAQGDNE